MSNRALVLALAFATTCGGSQPGADTTATTPEPEPAPITQPDTQVTRTPTVTIATDRKSYRAGDPVELRVVNGTANSYTYNPCMRIVERQSDSTWSEVKEDRICTMIAHLLEPNANRMERTELGEELKPGTYRLLLRFTNDSPRAGAESVTAYSEPIVVSP
jgi:hypothetical protein